MCSVFRVAVFIDEAVTGARGYFNKGLPCDVEPGESRILLVQQYFNLLGTTVGDYPALRGAVVSKVRNGFVGVAYSLCRIRGRTRSTNGDAPVVVMHAQM